MCHDKRALGNVFLLCSGFHYFCFQEFVATFKTCGIDTSSKLPRFPLPYLKQLKGETSRGRTWNAKTHLGEQ